jgi:hypothetical protein
MQVLVPRQSTGMPLEPLDDVMTPEDPLLDPPASALLPELLALPLEELTPASRGLVGLPVLPLSPLVPLSFTGDVASSDDAHAHRPKTNTDVESPTKTLRIIRQ